MNRASASDETAVPSVGAGSQRKRGARVLDLLQTHPERLAR